MQIRPRWARVGLAAVVALAAILAFTISRLVGSTPSHAAPSASPLPHTATPTPSRSANATLPRPDHVVIVIEENHSYTNVIGSGSAPYIDSLARGGANFTRFSAETHPSQPNYFALFSGSTQGITNDVCPPPGSPYSTANLGQETMAAGKTFATYNEGLPATGSTVCITGKYARKHNPWFSFSNVPASSGPPFTRFPSDFSQLPTVSFVVPTLQHDMHDGSIQEGDTWLKDNIDPYLRWARTHNSLLIVTWDEDDLGSGNQIPTIFAGPMVRSGAYTTPYNHFSLLRTVEDMYGTGHAGSAASARPITGVWTG